MLLLFGLLSSLVLGFLKLSLHILLRGKKKKKLDQLRKLGMIWSVIVKIKWNNLHIRTKHHFLFYLPGFLVGILVLYRVNQLQ